MSSTLPAVGDMTEPRRLKFTPACDASEARFERTLRLRGAHFRVESLQGEVSRTVTIQAELGYSGGALFVSKAGTVLFRSERENAWSLIAPQSLTFVECSASALIRVAKGEHSVIAVHWGQASLAVLDSFLAARREGVGLKKGWVIGSQPIHPHFTDAYERLENALQGADGVAEQIIGSVVLELSAQLLASDASHALAPAPKGLPDLMQKLIEEVRAAPAVPWPLKEAADFVGYSPFHFSRIFKLQVGLGFHEFVDRTRTEYAVRMLTTTDHPIDVVASESGFGTTQGLRESVKEYLGLVPSELRTHPEDLPF